MPNNGWQNNTELLGIIGALVISVISGTISIAQRILRGHPPSVLWVTTEYLSAILTGYIMYHAYPGFEHLMPEWSTRIMLVALAAHSGGRLIQEAERHFIERLGGKK